MAAAPKYSSVIIRCEIFAKYIVIDTDCTLLINQCIMSFIYLLVLFVCSLASWLANRSAAQLTSFTVNECGLNLCRCHENTPRELKNINLF